MNFYPPSHKGTKWVTYDYESMGALPRIPGCYVINCDGNLTYIGQTKNVGLRIANHGIRFTYGSSIRTPWGYFMTVQIKVRFASKMGDWLMREARLIQRLQPPMNCIGSTGEKRREVQ